MVSAKTKRRILEHKWSEHSNTSQFIKRRIKAAHENLDELILYAEEFAEPQIQEMFGTKKLELFIIALLNSKIKQNKKFLIAHMLLKYPLEHTEKLISNKLLKEQYKQHKKELKKIIDSIYHERLEEIGTEPTLDKFYTFKKK